MASNDFLRIFPEFRIHYGQDVNLDIYVTLTALNNAEKVVKFRNDPGVVLGEDGDMQATLQFYCSNATVKNQYALELQMEMSLEMKAVMENRILKVQITNGKITNTQVTTDNIDMFYHNYDALLNNVMQEFVPDFNIRHKAGFDMSSHMPPWVMMMD